jgi:predicted kinase
MDVGRTLLESNVTIMNSSFSHPRLIMLSGIPTSGKSSYVRQGQEETPYLDGFIVLSTDAYIERQARRQGRTYNDAFDELIGKATEDMENNLRLALRDNLSIIWDQTNLTPKVRRRKLAKVPTRYERTAVWFDIPLEEALRRNQQRPGKIIPQNILESMFHSFIPPTKSEGFDHIIRPLR